MPGPRTMLGMLATSAAVIAGMLAVPIAIIVLGGGQHWPGQHGERATAPPLVARGPQAHHARRHQRHEAAERGAIALATPATGPVALPPRRRAVVLTPRPAARRQVGRRRHRASPIAHIPPRRRSPPPAPAPAPAIPVAAPAPATPAPPVAAPAKPQKAPGRPVTVPTPAALARPKKTPPGQAKKAATAESLVAAHPGVPEPKRTPPGLVGKPPRGKGHPPFKAS